MNAMLTDEELQQLLGEAAGSFAVPEHEVAAPVRKRTPLLQKRWPKVAAGVAVFVAGAAFLSSTNLGSTANDTAANKSAAPSSDVGSVGGGTTGGLAPVPAPNRAVTTASGGGALRAAPQAAPAEVPASVPDAGQDRDQARIVRTGTIELQVGDGKVSPTVRRVQELVARAKGYVADSTSNEAGDSPSASLTVRVPVARFAPLLDDLRGLPVKVVSEAESGKDVTASYADMGAQIQSLTAARDRFLDILARAKTIAEILSVQQRVDDVQGQIDRLKGQRRVLADQSDYSTLTVSVSEKGADRILAAHERSGWSKAWYDAHHRFTSGLQRIVAGTGPALLVLLCAAALLLLGRSGWRVARRRLI